MVDVKSCLQGADLMQSIVQGLLKRDAHHSEMSTLPVCLATLIFLELQVHLVLQQGEIMTMMVIAKGLKGHLQVIVKDVPGIMTLFLGQNVHIPHWLVVILIVYV